MLLPSVRSIVVVGALSVLTGHLEAQEAVAPEVVTPLAAREVPVGGPPVTVMAQDSAGFMWLGTYYGLLRFDGRTAVPTSIADVALHISALHLDRGGNLWVGTAIGLHRMDPSTGEVTATYRHDPDDPTTLASDATSAIFEDAEGRLWVGALDWSAPNRGGLSMLDPTTGRATRFEHDPTRAETLSHDWVRTITQTDDGRIWVGTWDGLNEIDPSTGRVRRWYRSGESGRAISNDVKALLPSPDGSLWVGTLGGGLTRFDPKAGRFLEPGAADAVEGDPPGLFVMQLLEDPWGNVWVGTLDEGLARLDPSSGRITLLADDQDPASDWPDRIEAITVSNDGVLWFGGVHTDSEAGRLFTADLLGSEFAFLRTGSRVTAVAESPVGVVWALGLGATVHRWDRSSDEVRIVRCPSDDPSSAVLGGALAPAEDGGLWVGTWGDGICRIDAGGTTARLLPPPSDGGARFIGGIGRAADGDVWLSDGEARIYRIPRGTERLERWVEEVPSGRPYVVHAGGSEALLLLTDGGPHPWPPRSADSIAAPRPRWTVDRGGRLCRMDPPPTTCGVYGRELELLYLTGAHEDPTGVVWVTSNYDGLFRFDPATGEVRAVDVPLLRDRVVGSGATMTRSGELLLGISTGLVAMRTTGGIDRPPPRVHILDARAGEGSLAPDAETRVPHDRSDVVVRYTGLDYADPEGLGYEHRLLGLHDDFVDIGSVDEARYPDLPPGSYEFQVRAVSSRGVRSADVASLAFRVAAPWYANPVAYLAYLLIAAGTVVWYVRQSTQRVRLAADLTIEQNEKVRLRELVESRSRFFQNISHEFRTPLTLISGQIQTVLDGRDEEEGGSRGRLEIARQNVDRVGRMVDQILDLSKLEAGSLVLRRTVADLAGVVRLRGAAFESLAETRGIELTVEDDIPVVPVRIDREKIEMVLDNLLSNALKFTPRGGRVRLGVSVRPDHDPWPAVEVAVEDTGVGIASDDLPKIFERFVQVGAAAHVDAPGTGIGLAFARELVRLHEGEIEVESEPGRGSTFRVLLPLHESATLPPESPSTEPDSPAPSAPEPEEDDAGRPLVLIVEDHDELRAFLRDELRDAYEVIEAPNGAEGLRLATERLPELVLTDVMMPDVDGLELTRRLRADRRTCHIPIIALTARASEASRIEGLEQGVDDYLLKPFSRKVLRVRIRGLIDLRRTLRARYAEEIWIRPEEIDATPVDQEFLRSVQEAIEEGMANGDFGVDDLASAVFLSSSQLTRKLRALLDQTPARLIRSMRLARAADRIVKEGGALGTIALEVGFTDQAQFSRAFKQQYGITPSAYRARGGIPVTPPEDRSSGP